MFLRKRSELRELQSMRSLPWSICPILEPALKYLGGALRSLFSLYLKEETVLASLTLSGRSFHALIVEGRKELKKRFVFA